MLSLGVRRLGIRANPVIAADRLVIRNSGSLGSSQRLAPKFPGFCVLRRHGRQAAFEAIQPSSDRQFFVTRDLTAKPNDSLRKLDKLAVGTGGIIQQAVGVAGKLADFGGKGRSIGRGSQGRSHSMISLGFGVSQISDPRRRHSPSESRIRGCTRIVESDFQRETRQIAVNAFLNSSYVPQNDFCFVRFGIVGSEKQRGRAGV
jgi:hypothetical protein